MFFTKKKGKQTRKVFCNYEDKRMGLSQLRYQNLCMLTKQAPHGFNHYVKKQL